MSTDVVLESAPKLFRMARFMRGDVVNHNGQYLPVDYVVIREGELFVLLKGKSEQIPAEKIIHPPSTFSLERA